MIYSYQNKLSVLLCLISHIILPSAIGGAHAVKPEIKSFFTMTRNINMSSAIDRIFSYNWTENNDCFIELNAIKQGLLEQEEWAMKCELKMKNLNLNVFFIIISCSFF